MFPYGLFTCDLVGLPLLCCHPVYSLVSLRAGTGLTPNNPKKPSLGRVRLYKSITNSNSFPVLDEEVYNLQTGSATTSCFQERNNNCQKDNELCLLTYEPGKEMEQQRKTKQQLGKNDSVIVPAACVSTPNGQSSVRRYYFFMNTSSTLNTLHTI